MEIIVTRSSEELERLREPWQRLYSLGQHTKFQTYVWNVLAAQMFAPRQALAVVYADCSDGAAIIPATLTDTSGELRLLGEELFDYRTVLHHGNPAALHAAFEVLSTLGSSLKIVALREGASLLVGEPGPFCGAPALMSMDRELAMHPRLGRSLRRLLRQGCALNQYSGSATSVIRSIYERKGQQGGNLFTDRLRIDFMCRLADQEADSFDIFTLEKSGEIVSGLVTFRDGAWRRFYTTYFDERWAKLSPGVALLYEVALRSLNAGLHCDFMTGEQPYKMRLATSSVPLFTLRLDQAQMREIASPLASAA